MERTGPIVAVFGSSTAREPDETYGIARALGTELARAGASVMTGGYGGVMEACSRGAAEAGGHVIGVTVEGYAGRGAANRWVAEEGRARDLFERLRILGTRADAFVAVGPSLGTWTEVFLAWTLIGAGARPACPLVLLGPQWPPVIEAHRRARTIDEELFRFLEFTEDPVQAAHLALAGSRAQAGDRP